MRSSDYVNQACELKKQGKTDKAIKLLEKGLKEFDRNIFIINGLIELYEPFRFDHAKGLFNTAVKRGIADKVSYSLMIRHYIKENDLFNTRFLYSKSEMYYKADSSVRIDVLNYYLKNEYLIEAKQLYEDLCKENKANIVIHKFWLNHLYEKKRFSEGLEIINSIPEEEKDILLSIIKIEMNRKLKNYDYAMDLISKLFMKNKLEKKNETLLITIRAYCIKEKGEIEKAGTIFRNTFNKINEEDPNYIRVLCGMIFCHNVKDNEVEMFSNILMKAQRKNKGEPHDVSDALDLLNKKIYKRYKRMNSNKVKIRRNKLLN